MRDGEGSSTALSVLVIRTVHQLMDDLPHILDDPISPKLLDEEIIQKIRLEPETHGSRAARGLRSHIVLRSRYAEDELHEATTRFTKQFISLGAGYDTFPYRRPGWASGLRIVEFDHPETQNKKRAHFRATGLKDPDNLNFVPLDLENDSLLKGIAESGIDPRLPIWISCLGVFAYLRRETVLKVFETVAGLPKGSGIVFAFAPEKESETAAA